MKYSINSLLCKSIKHDQKYDCLDRTNYAQELQDAIISKNGKLAIVKKSIVHASKNMNKAKKICSMQFDRDADQVIVTYHLLRPQKSGSEPKCLEAGEVVIMCEQDSWRTVILIRKFLEGQDKGKWGYKKVDGSGSEPNKGRRRTVPKMDISTKNRRIGESCEAKTCSWT